MLGQLKHMYLIPTYFILHACVPPNKILLDIDSDEVEANVKQRGFVVFFLFPSLLAATKNYLLVEKQVCIKVLGTSGIL